MYSKYIPNLLGFGLYLQSIDPQNRTWQWHIQQTVVYCTIHFKRGIERAVRAEYQEVDKSPGTPYDFLYQLLFTTTTRDYDELCRRLISKCSKYIPKIYLTHLDSDLATNIQHWATHKKSAIFRSGLNQASSGIPRVIWESITEHTNAVEQTHYKSNAWGRYLSLLQTIQ
jgi:hypothetical protein